MALNKFYVYVIYRPWDDTPCYVGKGQGTRLREHQRLGVSHYNKHLSGVFKKAARLNLKVAVKKLYRGLSEGEAFEYEIQLISKYGRQIDGGILANLTVGGEGSNKYCSPERRRKVSITAKENWQNPDIRQRVVLGQLGHICTSEVRKKISAAQKGRIVSDERKLKISSSVKLLWQNPDYREKVLAARKRRELMT